MARATKSKRFLVVILPPHYSNRGGGVKAVLLPLIEWQALHKLDNKRIRK
jgi:hypothetical protein